MGLFVSSWDIYKQQYDGLVCLKLRETDDSTLDEMGCPIFRQTDTQTTLTVEVSKGHIWF